MSSKTSIRRASALAPGTCGELAQGMLDGVICMVTCPIDIYSRATVELSPGDGEIHGPPDSPKAHLAVQSTLDYLGETGTDAKLLLDSPLPRGKGMASSTADVSASIVATASAAGRHLQPAEVAGIALSIEPSDGVMFEGVSLFDHREGRVARAMGEPPPMYVVVLDFGGSVDTLAFNCVDRREALKSLECEMSEAVALIGEGIRQCDPVRIGEGATLSAATNQRVLPNANFDEVLAFSKYAGALGVNVAHSGTVLGLLFGDDAGGAKRAMIMARQRLGGIEMALCRRIVGGGVRLE